MGILFRSCFAALLGLGLFLSAGCPQPGGRPPADSPPRSGGPKPAAPRPEPAAIAVPCPPSELQCPAPPSRQPAAGRTVILDAGHGGRDEGTVHFGLREKDICLDLVLRAAALLRAGGVNVLLTRQADVFIPLPERSAFANRSPNAAFVSVHVNAEASGTGASGVETFVLSGRYSDSERARTAADRFRVSGEDASRGGRALADLAASCRARGPVLAGAMQRSLCARLGEYDRGVKPGDLSVLRETYFCPAVLVEVGFLTNSRTAARMRTEDWRRRAAEALAEGITEYLRQPL